MITLHDKQRAAVEQMTARLTGALGERLVAALLYGPATHGEHALDGELALLVVVADLDLATLDALRAPLAYWRKRGLATPRLFTRALLDRSRDVFPLELLDLTVHRELLAGADPLADLRIDDEHLRIQCERELSERLMRLREAYAEHGDSERRLRRLMIESLPAFTAVLRGALRLLGRPVPDGGAEVAAAFAAAAGLDGGAFAEVAALRRGRAPAGAVASLFARYYEVLERSALFLDRLVAAPAAPPQGAAS